MPVNRPQGRQRGQASSSGGVNKRGSGLGSGPVGGGYSGRPSGGALGGSGRGAGSPDRGPTRGGGGLIRIALIALLAVAGGGLGSVTGLFGGSNTSTYQESGTGSGVYGDASDGTYGGTSGGTTSGSTSGGTYGGTFGGAASGGFGGVWSKPQTTYSDTSYRTADTSVDPAAREKFTQLKGSGKDQVTILVYMCGTDLESNYGMATSDINEMGYAKHSDKVNIIVETGGTKRWKNTVMTSRTNQIWQVRDNGLSLLEKNLGAKQMTDPKTLIEFIQYGVKNFPADRYMLIFWDHGGGSVTGYGYDEVFPNGSMTLDEIADALKAGGVKFDFVGFDACLMATAETAVAVSPYADYMIASEETEPGTGWYYTNWLSTLAADSSTPTLEFGQQIVDDFITQSARSSAKSKTSLSIIDLAEFSQTVPSKLAAFAKGVTGAVKSEEYQTVADARSVTKEFAQSNRIDQIDLVHFCENVGTIEAKALAKALQSSVKYNRVNNMTNAYGVSIYFPYSSTSKVSSMASIYDRIGMEGDYTDAVRTFATLESSGQIVTGNSTSSLFDMLGGAPTSNGTVLDVSTIMGMLGGGSSSAGGMSLLTMLGGGSGIVDTGSLDMFSAFLGRNHVDSEALALTEKDGQSVLSLSEEQWSLIHDIELNVWADDGTGYIDLGLDNVFEFDADGNLIIDYDGLWISLNDQIVSYYMTAQEYTDGSDYVIEGYVPAMLNDERVNLLIEFTPAAPDGVVLGAQKLYEDGIEAKGLIEIEDGDVIDFLCDYYDYDGNYQDSYYLGEPLTVENGLTVGTYEITGTELIYGYRLTDIYNAHLWTEMQRY